MRKMILTTALLFAAPALAQGSQDAPKADDDIVVTGIRTTDKEIKAFVDAFTNAPAFGQLSRFENAVCPKTAGVSPSQRDAIIGRMRSVAKAAGMKLAPPDCSVNVMVIVTPDKKAMIEALEKKYPVYLTGLTGSEKRKLRESDGPAVAWHLKGPPRNADGVELQLSFEDGAYVDRTTRSPSRISFGARQQYAAAVVVIEEKALVGLSTTQIADFATMRTFIRTDPNKLKGTSAPTILNILDAPMGSEVPVTLTDWDLGILRGFYSSNPDIAAAAQRSEIREELKDGLENPGKN